MEAKYRAIPTDRSNRPEGVHNVLLSEAAPLLRSVAMGGAIRPSKTMSPLVNGKRG